MINPWRGLGGLPKSVWILSAATLVNRCGTMAFPFLILYLTRTQGYSASTAGLVLSGYGMGALVTAPFAGRLSDRIGSLLVMKSSLLLTGIIILLFPLAKSFPVIIACTVLWAIVSEAFRPANMANLTDLVRPENRKAVFSLNRLAINLGMSIGPAVGGFLFLISYDAIFWVNGATSLIAGFILVLVSGSIPQSTRASSHRKAVEATLGSKLTALIPKDARLLYFLAAMLPIFLVFFQHASTMPLFLVRDAGLAESDFGLLFTVNTVLIILIEVPLNLATARQPHQRMLAIAAVLVGVGFGSLLFVSNFFSAALTVVVWTFGEMILMPGASTYLAEISPNDRRGEYMGLFQMTFSLAMALGAGLGTTVLDRFGGTVLWSGTFVAGGASALLFWRLKGEGELPKLSSE